MQLLSFLGHHSSPSRDRELPHGLAVYPQKLPFRLSYANMPGGVAVDGTRSVQRSNEFCPDRIRPVFSHLAGAKRISGKRGPKGQAEYGEK